MYKVALIGAGQLGSRHLQSLGKIGVPVSLQVVDPRASSLDLARERLAQVGENPNVRETRFLTSIAELAPELDFCVIATSADVRLEALRSLLALSRVRYLLLEKVLFQSLAQLAEAKRLIEKSGVRAWVNCPRRLYPFYRLLKEQLAGVPLHYRVIGGGWGLACNGIHFIDHLAWLAEARLDALDISGLQPGFCESRRQGFVEVNGTLRGNYEKGSRIELTCSAVPTPVHIKIDSSEIRVSIEEGAGRATVSRLENGWEAEEMEFSIPFQSELTHDVATQLLENGSCGLTPFADSSAYHAIFLEALSRHLGSSECPIT